jgi:glycosyltransferase involved in cell wall biosynthesis
LLTDAFGGHGGIAKFNRDLLTALCANPAVEEVVAIPRLMPNSGEAQPPKLKYVTAGLGGKARYLQVLAAELRAAGGFDLLVCGHINLLPAAWPSARLTGARLLLVVHGIDAWRPTNNRVCNSLARRVDRFISVSKLTRDRFAAWTGLSPEKGFILPNSVDLARFTPGPRNGALVERYGLRGKKVVMTLGRLVSQERCKGFDAVLDVLPELARAAPDVAYLIAGDGSDRGRLEKKARVLGVSEWVVFAGMIPEDEKVDHYRLADVYAMPSKGEGFGIVFLEAMACGVPVIGSKSDGGREALRDGMLGTLVDPDSREELKAAILVSFSAKTGVVPEGLEYFSFEAFQERVDELLAIRPSLRQREDST